MPQLPPEPQKVVLPLGAATSDQSSMRWSGEGSPWWFIGNAQTHLGRMISDYAITNISPRPAASVEPSLIGPYFLRDFLEHISLIVQSDEEVRVVAGDRELFIEDINEASGGFSNITPLYSEGTVTVTNGSNVVSGAGTQWQTHGITPGSFFSIDYVKWYEITSISGNTSFQITPNYAEGSQSGIGYWIRRATEFSPTFSPDTTEDLTSGFFMGVRLTDLYVCGPYLEVSGFTEQDYALYKIGLGVGRLVSVDAAAANITRTPLLGGRNPPNTGVQSFGQVMVVRGMGLMDSGHILLLTSEYNIASPIASTIARLRWSSPVDDAEWLNEPAGFLDFAHVPGRPSALVETARGFEAHFVRGINLLVPTGLTSQPVAVQSTRASYGAAHPRAVVHHGGITYFLDTENNLRAWDGQRDQVIMPALQVRSQIGFQNVDLTSPPTTYYFARQPQLALAYSQFHDALVIYGMEDGDPSAGTANSQLVFVSLSDGGQIGNKLYDFNAHVRGFSELGRIGLVSGAVNNIRLSGYERRVADGQAEARTARTEVISKAMDFGYPGYLKTITRVAFNFRGDLPEDIDASLGSGQLPDSFPDPFLYRFRRTDFGSSLVTGLIPPGTEQIQQLVWYPAQDGTTGGANAIGDDYQQAQETWILGFRMEHLLADAGELDSVEIEYQVLGPSEVDVDASGA